MPRTATPNLSITVEEYIEHRWVKHPSVFVRQGLRSLLYRFIKFHGDRPTGAVQPADLADFFYGPEGVVNTCSRSTLSTYRGVFVGYFDWCEQRGYHPKGGTYLVSLLKERSQRSTRVRTRLDEDEILRLIDGATLPRDRAMLALAANTGLRISEIWRLRVRDVDLRHSEIRVYKPKTDEQMTYYITAELDAELRGWLMQYAEDMGEVQKGWYLFPARTKQKFGPGRVNHREVEWRPNDPTTNHIQIIRRAAKAAGIELEEGDGWHTIRRSTGRIFFERAKEEGYDGAMRMTQAFYGHASIRNTELYLGMTPEKAKVREMMQGKHFIGAGVQSDNVVPLRKTGA